MDRGENALHEALEDLDQYLADNVPPLLAVGSLRLLMYQPSRLLAEHLVSWAATAGGATPGNVGDPLAKALVHIYLLADLQLVPKKEMQVFFLKFQPILLEVCPAEDRGKVRSVIAQLLEGGHDPFLESARELSLELDKQGLAGFSSNLASRLVPLLEKMTRSLLQETKAGSPSEGKEVVSQFLAAVTRTADTPQQLDENLDRLKTMGLKTDVPSVLRTLGGSVPNWAVVSAPRPVSRATPAAAEPKEAKVEPVVAYSDTRLRAMQRIVELGKIPEESYERFAHMLQTAVEEFNHGASGRAVSILESARQLIAQERIPTIQANPRWDRAALKIQWHRFEISVADPVQHQLLRQFLSFFPSLSIPNLLDDLKRTEDKASRRLLISLLQLRGEAVRSEVWRRLELLLEEAEPDWEYGKDMVGLLASIPTPEGAAPQQEIKLLTRLAILPVPVLLFRELVRYGTQINLDLPAGLLTALLDPPSQTGLTRRAELETKPPSQWTAAYEQILARLAYAREPSARRLLLKYCLVRATRISAAPLAGLGSRDLTTEPTTMTRLLTLLNRYLPSGWISWIWKPKEHPLLDLVRALSGTSSPQVRDALSQVAKRFPTRSFGIAAAKALQGEREPEVPEETRAAASEAKEGAAALESDILPLEGELHSFNLPTLLQHLEASAATGVLELLNSTDSVEGTATFVKGQLFHCQTGSLRGQDALYALLEKPVFGRFRLKDASVMPAVPATAGEPTRPLPVASTLVEGMKRHDEYQQLRLLVSDEVVLTPTGQRPGRPQGEDDVAFVRQVWSEAVSGKTAAQCEAAIAVDPYRIRRLLAYWMADGVLREVPVANIRRPEPRR